MSNLTNHAKKELQAAGLFDESGDFYGGHTGKAVLELVETFANQGHSGMSAGLVINLFSKVANFKPIGPIRCTDDEWVEVGSGQFQNSRCPAVFKTEVEGKPYYLDAIVWEEEDGCAFTGEVAGIKSRQFVKLPFTPKTFYVKVSKGREILDHKTLEDAFAYYD